MHSHPPPNDDTTATVNRGILITGTSRTGYTISWQDGHGAEIPIADLTRNHFTRKRDAQAALERLQATDIEWDTDVRERVKTNDTYRATLEEQIREGLTGKTRAKYDAEQAASREIQRRHDDGTASRDAIDSLASSYGHSIAWRKVGLRNFRGRCGHCNAVIRSSYIEHTDSFRRTGPANQQCPHTQERSA
jgi:hypothetical protein